MAAPHRPKSRDEFEIAIICALPVERDAVEALFDKNYETHGFSYGKAVGDRNAYTIGKLGNQHVVLAYMPGMGNFSAAAVAANIFSSFRGIKIGLIVGVCGGVPTTSDGTEILLGDVIISTSIIQVDFGQQYSNKFIRKNNIDDTLGRANPEIRAFLGKLSGYTTRGRLRQKTCIFSTEICTKEGLHKSAYHGPESDKLFPSGYRHKHQSQGSCAVCNSCRNEDDDVCKAALQSSCAELGCDEGMQVRRKRLQNARASAPYGQQISNEVKEARMASIHFGRIASSNSVMKSGHHRDCIAAVEKVIGFEMEGAGAWEYIPTVVIKGVCDYADSHKNKGWQQYAAATAAACTKAVLEEWRTEDKLYSSKYSLCFTLAV
jgi:nucleoside phosphorylase